MANPFGQMRQRLAHFIAPRPTERADVAVTSAAPPNVSGYEGASMAKRMAAWVPNRNHVNTLLAGEAPLLRARTRSLIANSPYASNASETFVCYATGTGIVPAPNVPTPEMAAQIKEAFTDWTDEADADGLTDFYGLQSMASRALFDSGECFARVRDRFASDGLSVPLQVQLLEAEQLDQSFTQVVMPNSNNTIRQGIEFDPIGRRVAYHFWRNHPGDMTLRPNMERTRVPAEQVIHLFKPLRPGQIRGRPWLTAAMVKMYDLDQYDDAELLRKKFTTMFMAFFVEQAGSDISDTGLVDQDTAENATDPNGTANIALEPGLGVMLPKGIEPKFTTPTDVGGSYEPFIYRQLLGLCAGMGLPYHEVTGDTSKANYSSLRASLLGVRRRIEQFQHEVMVYQFCRAIYNRWLPAAVVSGAVRIPGFGRTPKLFLRCKWIPPRWDWVDPLKDMQAEKLAVDSGFKARSQVIEEMGDDPRETDARIKEDRDREKSMGISFPVGFTKNPDAPAGSDQQQQQQGDVPPSGDGTQPPAQGASEQQPIHIEVPITMPSGATRTTVVKKDARGRIEQFIQEPIEPRQRRRGGNG